MIRGTLAQGHLAATAVRSFVSSARVNTQYTTLSNGVTIATEKLPNSSTSKIGLYFVSGSRSESIVSNGISALTTSALARGSKNGVYLEAENTKEFNGLVAHSSHENVPVAAQLISEIVSTAPAVLEKADVAFEKLSLASKARTVEADPSKKIELHLSGTAFQGYSLALPAIGSETTIKNLELQDMIRLVETRLVGNNIVVAGSGNFEHDALVDVFEKSLKVERGAKLGIKPATFLGSEIRMRDDTLPKAYVTIAVQGSGITSPDYYTSKVAAAVFGSFNKESTFARFTSPKLASIVQEYGIVDSYEHFSTSYSDTGLWGLTSECSNVGLLDEFVHFALKQWNRLSVSMTETEISRAKASVKTAVLAKLGTPETVTSDIAEKVLLLEYRPSTAEILERIDKITLADVQSWAKTTVYDQDIAISATGQIEALFEYMRIRNEMSMMRW